MNDNKYVELKATAQNGVIVNTAFFFIYALLTGISTIAGVIHPQYGWELFFFEIAFILAAWQALYKLKQSIIDSHKISMIYCYAR